MCVIRYVQGMYRCIEVAIIMFLCQNIRRLVSQFSGKRESHPIPNLEDFERHNNRY